jgi:hypothetical protein
MPDTTQIDSDIAALKQAAAKAGLRTEPDPDDLGYWDMAKIKRILPDRSNVVYRLLRRDVNKDLLGSLIGLIVCSFFAISDLRPDGQSSSTDLIGKLVSIALVLYLLYRVGTRVVWALSRNKAWWNLLRHLSQYGQPDQIIGKIGALIDANAVTFTFIDQGWLINPKRLHILDVAPVDRLIEVEASASSGQVSYFARFNGDHVVNIELEHALKLIALRPSVYVSSYTRKYLR